MGCCQCGLDGVDGDRHSAHLADNLDDDQLSGLVGDHQESMAWLVPQRTNNRRTALTRFSAQTGP